MLSKRTISCYKWFGLSLFIPRGWLLVHLGSIEFKIIISIIGELAIEDLTTEDCRLLNKFHVYDRL